MLFAHLKCILKLDRLRLRGPNGARDEFFLAPCFRNAPPPPHQGRKMGLAGALASENSDGDILKCEGEADEMVQQAYRSCRFEQDVATRALDLCWTMDVLFLFRSDRRARQRRIGAGSLSGTPAAWPFAVKKKVVHRKTCTLEPSHDYRHRPL